MSAGRSTSLGAPAVSSRRRKPPEEQKPDLDLFADPEAPQPVRLVRGRPVYGVPEPANREGESPDE